MKKSLMILMSILFLVGCGAKESTNKSKDTLMDNPDVDEIVKRIEGIDGIIDVCMTDNSYDDDVATIYFRLAQIEKNAFVETDDACEEEVKGGGSIVVYETEEIAKEENDHQSKYDGMTTVGYYHSTKGKILFLFSTRLSEEEYKAIETEIYDALSK